MEANVLPGESKRCWWLEVSECLKWKTVAYGTQCTSGLKTVDIVSCLVTPMYFTSTFHLFFVNYICCKKIHEMFWYTVCRVQHIFLKNAKKWNVFFLATY